MAKKSKTREAAPEAEATIQAAAPKLIPAIDNPQAPFIYFDSVPTFGVNHGVVHVTLEAVRYHSDATTVTRDRVTVGHLRMSLAVAQSLKNALEGTLKVAAQNPNAVV